MRCRQDRNCKSRLGRCVFFTFFRVQDRGDFVIDLQEHSPVHQAKYMRLSVLTVGFKSYLKISTGTSLTRSKVLVVLPVINCLSHE